MLPASRRPLRLQKSGCAGTELLLTGRGPLASGTDSDQTPKAEVRSSPVSRDFYLQIRLLATLSGGPKTRLQADADMARG